MNWRLFLAISGLVILAVTPAGCAGKAEAHTDAAKAITVAVDEEFTIALEANITTGYSWQSDYDKTLLSLVRDDYEATPVPKGVVGSGGTHSFRFKPLKPGQATVTFTYRQSWMPPSGTDRKRTFTVTIR